MLLRLRIPHVKSQGYVNLRCVWTLGCPIETRPSEEAGKIDGNREAKAGPFYAEAFSSLFPGQPVPAAIGSPCCAQLAVTGDKIRERPRSDYEAYREWLLNTELPDEISGRVMEYSWHRTPLSTFPMVTLLSDAVIFGQQAVSCPIAGDCYCETYGLCNLTCENEGVCQSQYTLPKVATLPDGWPNYGWEGKWRNVTQLRIHQEEGHSLWTAQEESGVRWRV